jgi:hypothetical protein
MLTRPGPFYIIEIARALARKPGRVEVDREEAHRITDDIAERYLRGEFGDDDVVADHAGPPPARRSLAEIKEDARRRGEIWCLSQPEWREAYMLTTSAARRYVEGCGLAGAARVQKEWFGRTDRVKPAPHELRDWMLANVKPGAKRDPTIRACRDATGATWRAAIAAWKALPKELKLKRGKRAAPRKTEQ